MEGESVGRIGRGLLILLGAGVGDGEVDAAYLADKVAGLRIFPGGDGQMNLALADVGGAVLVVSQFTLNGDCRKGRRPAFVDALGAGPAEALYQSFVARLRASGLAVETGRFRAMMDVELVNDGPVTLLLDSRKQF